MQDALSTFLEVSLYVISGAFCIFAATHTLPMGLTAFSAGSLLTCFSCAAWSIYKLLVRGV